MAEPRRRTRSMSQSGDESDTPQSATKSMVKPSSKKPTLETVAQSPETSVDKKLSFTPALNEGKAKGKAKGTPSKEKGKKEAGVSFGGAPPATPTQGDKPTARATSSKRSKRAAAAADDDDDDDDDEVDEVDGKAAPAAAPPPAADPKSAKKSAKKAAKEAAREAQEEEAKAASPAAAKKVATPVAAPSAKELRKSEKKAAKAASPAAPVTPATSLPGTPKHKSSASAKAKPLTPQPAGVAEEGRKGRCARKKAKRAREAAALKGMTEGATDAALGIAAAQLAVADKSRWQLEVHRCRFVGWMPAPIHALAALPTAASGSGGHLLCVARAGGDLELVNVDERWAIAARCAGPRGGSSSSNGGASTAAEVRSLCWVGGAKGCGPSRAVGGTLGGVLFEADFSAGVRAHEVDALGGAVWAVATSQAVQPARRQAASKQADGSDDEGSGNHKAAEVVTEQLVAAGCEDGTVRVFRCNPSEGGLEYVKSLGPVGARVTSLAWAAQGAADGASGKHGILFAGTADGTIHKFDVASGRADSRMTLERRGSQSGSGAGGQPDSAPGGSHVVVWSLLALKDGTVVSGDSSGAVQFWDGATCSHVSRLATHGGDVLCLAATGDERTVFASGTDHKVVALKRLAARSASAHDEDGFLVNGEGLGGAGLGGEASVGAAVWSVAHAYRAHQLDVRALAVVSMGKQQHQAPPVKGASAAAVKRNESREILVSGGLDTKLCTYHARRFEEHRPKRIWPFPYHDVVSVAPQPRLLLAMHADRLELWHVPKATAAKAAQAATSEGKEAVTAVGHTLLLQLKLKLASSLVCSALSPDGTFLAASDSDRLRLFKVTHVPADPTTEGAEASVVVTKIALTGSGADAPCQRLCFDGSRRVLGATLGGKVHVLSLSAATSSGGLTAALEHAFPFAGDVRSLARAETVGRDMDDDDDDDDDEVDGCGPFSSLAVSPDGQWCAAACCSIPTSGGSGRNSVLVYSLDSMALFWAPPRPAQRVTSLAFNPHSLSGAGMGGRRDAGLLCAAAVDNRFHLYDVEARRLADWSADNGNAFPPQLLHRADALVGACFAPAEASTSKKGASESSGKLLVRSHGFLCLIDLAQAVPPNARIHPPSHLAAKNDVARRGRLENSAANRAARAGSAADRAAVTAAAATPGKSKAGSALLSPAALAAMEQGSSAGGLDKRKRSNSVNSAASADSAKLVNGLTPVGRRMRSDSVTSATSEGDGTLLPAMAGPPRSDSEGGSDDEGEAQSRNFAITLKYRPVIFAGFLGPNEVVVVEEPWLKIMARLPDPLFRQRFGT